MYQHHYTRENILEYDFTFEIISSDPVEPNKLNGSVLIVSNDGEFVKWYYPAYTVLYHGQNYSSRGIWSLTSTSY